MSLRVPKNEKRIGEIQMELGGARGHRVSVERIRDYAIPRSTIKLVILDVDNYSDFLAVGSQ